MKKHLLLVAIALCMLPLLSKSQVIEWQNTIGGNSLDRINSMQQTTDGGYIIGGSSYSSISGDKTENSNGTIDFWLVKIDAFGNIQWQNTIGGSNDDEIYSVKQTPDGGYIVGGWSMSNISGDKTENCIGESDFWIVKTDASGNIMWENTIGGDDVDWIFSIDLTSDGGYILGGYSFSGISGDKTENSMGIGSGDYWIVKTDSISNIVWQNTIGGSGPEMFNSIQSTADGGYILGGYSASNISGDKTEICDGAYDFWVVKIDALGSIQWQNTIGGSGYDELYSVHQTADGGYILGGTSNSNISGDKTENCIGLQDYWIVKTDSLGVIQWQNTIGGNHFDQLMSIVQTSDGGYMMGGWSLSNISGDKTENAIGYDDYWIVKTDASGNIQWQKTIGGVDGDELYTTLQTNDGGYLLGGYSSSNISGDKTEICNGGYDFWIIKVTERYNSITGKLFIDANSNGTLDTGEAPVTNKQVTELNTGKFEYSGQNGSYSVSVFDSGNYVVSPAALNYYTAVPATQSANFTGILQIDSLNNFALQPAGVFNDLCVSITPLGPFRAGFNASYQITYENVGTTSLSPIVIFFQDSDVTYISSLPIATSYTSDSLVWNFGPLAPFQQGYITITVNVNTGTPIGTLINSSVRIEPIAGDANTTCNQSYWEVLTTGSADPNDIVVDQDTLLTTQFPNPPYLEYIIRFQNTGNDTAFTVKVMNSIDTNLLDLSSFEFVAASHPVNLDWLQWEKNMRFQFDNILLADSNVNEPASHGFIRYRIKPKSTLIAGDSITNRAAICFDFNAPVITNTAVTRIESPTSLTESIVSFDNLLLYPNPANSILNIEVGIASISNCRIIITDVAGRTIYTNLIANSSAKQRIDISTFSQGIYFVQVENGAKTSRGRFVKN